MRRVVVFVEGQAEQIFIRELLLRRFGYARDVIGIRCYKLVAESFQNAEYDFGDDDAQNFFMIINAGCDNKVLSAMIKRAPRMLESGFHIVIGLRDMYSEYYKELSPNVVSDELNEKMIAAARNVITTSLGNVAVNIHYAVMEVEAWMLALLDKWKGEISEADISQYFASEGNVEHIYHPAEVVRSITAFKGDPYDKHADQVNSIVSNINWSDYMELYESGRCPSFNDFLIDLLEME